MNITLKKNRCPYCHRRDFDRIVRKRWMRLLGRSKRYRCASCGRKFLVLG